MERQQQQQQEEEGRDWWYRDGIGVVSCVYANPRTQCLWVVDYRLFDPDTTGKKSKKLDHVKEMLGVA